MMKDRLTRPWTGALFRARRVQCALLLMTAMIGSAGVMTGCKGTFRVTAGPIIGEAEFTRNPGPDRGRRCGSMTYNGRTYDLYCDAQGRIIYAHDPVADRWYRITMQEEAGWLPPDYPAFEHDGVMYILPPEPIEHALELPEGMTALEVAEAWGADADLNGVIQGAGTWTYNRSTRELDARLCLDWSIGIGTMDLYPLGSEMLLLSDETAGIILHRVVGPRTSVIEYLNGMGLEINEFEIDGFGLFPLDLIETDDWLVTMLSSGS